jgi:hypothetical protein
MRHYVKADIEREDNAVTVRLSGSAIFRTVDAPGVVDVSRMSDIVGIEILNFLTYVDRFNQGVSDVSPQITGRPITYSFDDASDSFYLRILEVDAPKQISARARLSLDEKNRLVEVSASW